MVVNKFNEEKEWSKYFEHEETKSLISDVKDVYKKRHIKSKHISLSTSVANTREKDLADCTIIKKLGF